MFFVGIDIAWSDNNPTGIAVIEGDRESGALISVEIVETDGEIVDFVEEIVGEDNALITVDAPLTVPNETGRRPAEDAVGKLFSKYDAGAHPANRKILSQWTGSIRGEDIVEKFEEKDFDHNPYVSRFEGSRKVMEVYPHPSMVALFDMDSILKYKNKPGRDYEFLYNEFRKYQQHIKDLRNTEPSLKTPDLVRKEVEGKIGQELKAYEDKLDAVFCAYIGYFYWARPDKCEVLGSEEEGYIMTPLKPDMEEDLREFRNQKSSE